ncbi:unnamed protein product [Protopolystoma xenopodis]|uniref:Uncharacterized protein n=1 Tax=Protopolystoma xenopodis TaxID=117903 RepID=A0A448XQX8_9PLAT|nr:unnamed protein product [Protopolystoma xenopodis]
MASCSDDVRHNADVNLVQFHRGHRTVSGELLRTIRQFFLRDNPPRIHSSQLSVGNGEPRHSIHSASFKVKKGLVVKFSHNDMSGPYVSTGFHSLGFPEGYTQSLLIRLWKDSTTSPLRRQT